MVALVGGEEMAAARGHLEFLFVRALPEHRLKFRSLSKEGDTVFQQPRDFNYPPLERQLRDIGATVVIAQFGQMESLGGPDRLGEFTVAYDRLMNRLGDGGKRRMILITAKGRPLLTPPKIAGAELPELFELLRARDRWPHEQARRVLFGGDTARVTAGLLRWCEHLDPGAPDIDFALAQALGVLEAHETAAPAVLERVLAAKTPAARANAAGAVARWSDRLLASFDPVGRLKKLAHDADPRVRLAAVVAAGNILRTESMDVVLTAAEQPRDTFIELALRAAAAVLKPRWEPALAQGAVGWKPAWHTLVKELDRPKPAPPTGAVIKTRGTPIVPVFGRLRASPYVTGSVAAEVLARGNPKRGAEIFRRPELACLTCHRVGEEGGEIGPRLDSIGRARPLETLIGKVIEPQRQIAEGFDAIKVTTRNGDVVVGIVVAGNNSELTLRDTGGNEHVVPAANIANREMIGSLMPAGLTDPLSPEDLRDLFAYLTQLGKVK